MCSRTIDTRCEESGVLSSGPISSSEDVLTSISSPFLIITFGRFFLESLYSPFINGLQKSKNLKTIVQSLQSIIRKIFSGYFKPLRLLNELIPSKKVRCESLLRSNYDVAEAQTVFDP